MKLSVDPILKKAQLLAYGCRVRKVDKEWPALAGLISQLLEALGDPGEGDKIKQEPDRIKEEPAKPFPDGTEAEDAAFFMAQFLGQPMTPAKEGFLSAIRRMIAQSLMAFCQHPGPRPCPECTDRAARMGLP